jgi:hypothetical protein
MKNSIELTANSVGSAPTMPRRTSIRLPRAKTITRKVDMARSNEYRAHRRMINQQVKNNLRAELTALRNNIIAHANRRMYHLTYFVPGNLHNDAQVRLLSILRNRLELAGYKVEETGRIPYSFEVNWLAH